MSHHRRIGTIIGAALLLTVTGCSGLGRNSVGQLTFTNRDTDLAVSYSNTLVRGCHPIGPNGATTVVNNTLIDVVLYRSPNCEKKTAEDSTYVGTTLSNNTAPGSLPWQSFSFIH
ncbi:hypothetical protein [Streptomyces sp. NPDC006879]|uniref:hypothetical protein n=1 Tax=Streptomyces sp. NPDC006879 TaxID=3364767 RepID=UPI0036AF8B7B